MDSTQAQLIALLKQREPAALTTLFEQYANPLYRLALRLLHDPAVADDVVQNSFLALIEHIDRFEGRARIQTWLFRVAFNDIMARLRERPDELVNDEADDVPFPAALIDWRDLPEDILSQGEAAAEMDAAIQRLTPAQRAVFTLRDIEELSTQETAEALGMSEGAVKVALHRARLALRERLSAYFIEFNRT